MNIAEAMKRAAARGVTPRSVRSPRASLPPRQASPADIEAVRRQHFERARTSLSDHEARLLERFDRRGGQAGTHVEGTTLVLAPMSEAQALSRMREMIAQGIAPSGPGVDFARVSNTEFKTR